MQLFDLQNYILNTLGQAWNYFALLGCSRMYIHDIHDQSSNHPHVLTGMLPNGKHVRYVQYFNEDQIEKAKNHFNSYYNSNTNKANALPFLNLHFHLNAYREYIEDFRMGSTGVSVLFRMDGNIFSLEMSHHEFGTMR